MASSNDMEEFNDAAFEEENDGRKYIEKYGMVAYKEKVFGIALKGLTDPRAWGVKDEEKDDKPTTRPTTPTDENKLYELLNEAYKEAVNSEFFVLVTKNDKTTLTEKEIVNKYFSKAYYRVIENGCYEAFSFEAVVHNSYEEDFVYNFYQRHRREIELIKPKLILKHVKSQK